MNTEPTVLSTVIAIIVGIVVFGGACFLLYFFNKFLTRPYEHSDTIKRLIGR